MTKTEPISPEAEAIDEMVISPAQALEIREALMQKEAMLSNLTMRYIKSLEDEQSPESDNVLDLIAAIPPYELIEAGGQVFVMSDVLKIGGRFYCVGYVNDENARIAPRLFYKSKSEGEWRACPYVEMDDDGRAFLSKGEKFDGGYVRETMVGDELKEYLLEREFFNQGDSDIDEDWLYNRFTLGSLGSRNIYPEVADTIRLKSLPEEVFRFKPGEGFKVSPPEETPAEQIAKMEIDKSIKPIFSTGPIREMRSRHDILGDVITEVYTNAYDNLEWRFSRDKEGRVWLSGITTVGDRLNSYGVSEEVILGGVLDNKPIEYDTQVGGLYKGRDFVEIPGVLGYVDITPLLDNLPIIQEYRSARLVNRTN